MKQKFEQVSLDLKNLHLKQFLKKYSRYFVRIENFIVFQHNCIASLPSVQSPKLNIELRDMTKDALENIIDLYSNTINMETELTKEELEERLLFNHACVGAYFQNMWCGYSWCSTHYLKIQKSGSYTLEPADIAYIFGSYVLPEYRGRGISSSLCNYLLTEFKKRGCKRFLAIVKANNIASIKVQMNTGFSRMGNIILITIFSKIKFIITKKIDYKIIKQIESLRGKKF